MKFHIATYFLQALSLSTLLIPSIQGNSDSVHIAEVITRIEEQLQKDSYKPEKSGPASKTKKDNKLEFPSTQQVEALPNIHRATKPWTLLIYIAANNNLNSFAIQNLNQMTKVGSSDNLNIVVQFDGLKEGKIKRYYIEYGRARLLEELSPSIETISGTPQSLYQFIKWGYETFPATNLAIDLWNHGSGIKDPSIWGKFLMRNRDSLFSINSETGLLSLNRRLSATTDDLSDPEDNPPTNTALEHTPDSTNETRNLFADITLAILEQRGIAFNDKEEVYIDNRQLRLVLENTCKYVLVDKKIDIVFMDACHMGMVELASKLRPYVDFMVGSSEVEPGNGYNYQTFLAGAKATALTPRQFAINGVVAYGKEYKNSHDDYTQAAVDLSTFGNVEQCLKNLGIALNKGLQLAESSRVFDLIKVVRLSSKFTTEFYDPDYIDAGDLLANLFTKSREILDSFGTSLGAEQYAALDAINKLSGQAYTALQASIIAEVHGTGLARSRGLGILFPKRTIHVSYINTTFNRLTNWSEFLKTFLTQLRYTRSMPTA